MRPLWSELTICAGLDERPDAGSAAPRFVPRFADVPPGCVASAPSRRAGTQHGRDGSVRARRAVRR